MRSCQKSDSISICLKNSPAKFHSDPIWNDRALGFFGEGYPNKKNKDNIMSSDMGSVPDPIKIISIFFQDRYVYAFKCKQSTTCQNTLRCVLVRSLAF